MPRCCATILDPTDGKVVAYAEVYADDVATGTAAATATATAMYQTLNPGQPVPQAQTKTVPGKANGAKFPPPSS